MTMNPRNYDVDELKGMADDPIASVAADGHEEGTASPEDVVRSNQYRELVLLEKATGDLEKPYLDELPEAYAAELTIFEWLEFLMEEVGFKRTLETLSYYRSIGWLSEDAEDALSAYLRSFDDTGEERTGLDRSDHVLSLVYIARLASMTEDRS